MIDLSHVKVPLSNGLEARHGKNTYEMDGLAQSLVRHPSEMLLVMASIISFLHIYKTIFNFPKLSCGDVITRDCYPW